ncbi:MAG: class I adenylate cyclase, partial [Gammaproteobacteria bacterium]
LDEFYRSGLLVAGLPPLWWRVPSRYDGDYDAYTRHAIERRVIDARDYIDFGGLPTIPAEEFFGAAVWQLYKSIESPYKSVLKLLLMEAYAAEYPHIRLLCSRYKQAIEGGQSDLNALDPYMLMYAKVEEHLMARNDAIRLDVLRRSFYIKANVRVSELGLARTVDWRGEMMQHLVAQWGWSQGRSVLLDQRDTWRIGTAIEERRDVTNTLKESYAALSLFVRNHAGELKITERDLHVLGRKLYAAFEKKPSKIEIITRGICSNPHEPNLSLHEVRLGDASYVWLLFSGTVTPAEAAFRRPMKRSSAAAELVLWCHLNRLADLTTTWHVFTSATALSGMDIRRMHEMMAASLDDGERGASADELAAPPRIGRVLLLANVGVNPFAGTLADGAVLTSDHSDPFQYGGRGINLVRSIDFLFTTSWNEAFAFRYVSSGALFEALCECLGWNSGDTTDDLLPSVESRCFSADHATTIARRVQETFVDTLRFLSRRVRGETRQFVLEAGGELHQLRFEQGAPRLDIHTSQVRLLRELGQAGHDDAFRRVRFDRGGSRLAALAAIYRHNQPDKVQVFARQHGDRADAFILDERGLLLVQRHECDSMPALLEHYHRFLNAALARCLTLGDAGQSVAALGIETAEIIGNGDTIQLKPYAIDAAALGNYLTLQVLADADSRGHQQFTIIAGAREFSTWEHGGSLFMQVAEFVHAQRRDGETYPIYITDLDLSRR